MSLVPLCGYRIFRDFRFILSSCPSKKRCREENAKMADLVQAKGSPMGRTPASCTNLPKGLPSRSSFQGWPGDSAANWPRCSHCKLTPRSDWKWPPRPDDGIYNRMQSGVVLLLNNLHFLIRWKGKDQGVNYQENEGVNLEGIFQQIWGLIGDR